MSMDGTHHLGGLGGGPCNTQRRAHGQDDQQEYQTRSPSHVPPLVMVKAV
jgi:hypothetical protein